MSIRESLLTVAHATAVDHEAVTQVPTRFRSLNGAFLLNSFPFLSRKSCRQIFILPIR